MTPASGDNDRPVLVLYVDFTDAAAPAGKDPTFFSNLFFGSSYGSVADFYRAASFGKLRLTPAAEASGTNDGVVRLTIGTQATFDAPTNDANRGRQALLAADPFVNFKGFDRNGDGRVGADELLLYMIEVRPAFCGGTRAVGATLTLDGVDLGGRQWSGATDTTNAETHVHELSHQGLGAWDPAGYWPWGFDVHSGTCIPPGTGSPLDTSFWGFNAWEKMHLGWIRPTVVTRDGYYAVRRADTTDQAYILYDPARGTNDYLLVENRERTPGTYDKDVTDSGLVVFRFDESMYGDAKPWVQLLAPGSAASAWDPSDPKTPQRKLIPSWRDGTPSKLAIRAIGPKSDVISVYFDVRGPGVLADSSQLPLFKVRRGATRPLTIPVTNTGEDPASFAVTVQGLPLGWSSSVATISLAGQATGNVTVRLTTGAAARPGGVRLALTAWNTTETTVRSTSLFWAFVPVDGSDRDADGKADAIIFRPTNGDWWMLRSANGAERVAAWGEPGDIPVPGDYDGDGRTDVAVYRWGGQWWIVNSLDRKPELRSWGSPGDVPAPADYDGDGKTDLAVFRQSTGEWLIRFSATGASRQVSFGRLGDVVTPADYDGDGKDDIAVWRSVPGEWWVVQSSTGGVLRIDWGKSGNLPVPGDYDGDGRADFGIFDPLDGVWSIRSSAPRFIPAIHVVGAALNDVPVPADYDGDGVTDAAIFRSHGSYCEWWIRDSHSGLIRTVNWGEPGDLPAT